MRAQLMVLVGLLFGGALWAGPADQSIDGILKDYFKIHTALAQDSTEGVATAAQSITQKATSIRTTDPEVQKLLTQITIASRDFEASSLDKARESFFELSKPLLAYLNQFHAQKDQYYRYFCTMKQRAWIQPEKETQNPYTGQAMLGCGQLIK
jgi:hypothetical protein